jgi:SAM-dependent methyltransferase
METPQYAPSIFSRETVEEARQIILTPEAGLSTDERWERETAWLMQHIRFPAGLIVDYGCGIGRMAKQFNRAVLGVDISPTMRAQAVDYVGRQSFDVTHPAFFAELVQSGLRVAGAMAIWCLQHCLTLEYDCQVLRAAMQPLGCLWTLDAPIRYIPASVEGGTRFVWADDHRSVEEALVVAGFAFDRQIPVPETLVQPGCFLRLWRV